MRKRNENRIGRNKLLALAIAATFLVSTISISLPTAFAAPPSTVSAGSGQGSIFYTANRIPDSHWESCFAETCDQGTGPGTWIWFVVFNEAAEIVANGLANEDGVFITGLDVGKTYYLQPTDCEYPGCGEPPHDVKFNNWHDCDTNQQRPIAITSTSAISAAAYYRYHLHGESDVPLACHTSSSPSPPSGSTPPPTDSTPPPSGGSGSSPGQDQDDANTGSPSTDGSSFWDNVGSRIELQTMVARAEQMDLAALQTTDESRIMLTAEMREIAAAGPKYESFYELVESEHPGRLATAMMAAEFAGINFNNLREEDRLSVVLLLLYGTPTGETTTAADVPDTNLSGIPLGTNGVIIEYNSFYDVVNSHAKEVALVMRDFEFSGGDFGSLSETQKSYLVLTQTYGEPQ